MESEYLEIGNEIITLLKNNGIELEIEIRNQIISKVKEAYEDGYDEGYDKGGDGVTADLSWYGI